MVKPVYILIMLAVLAAALPATAQDDAADVTGDAWAPLRPPSELRVEDTPNDAGKELVLRWSLSPDDTLDSETTRVRGYLILRTTVDDDDDTVESMEVVAFVPAQIREYADKSVSRNRTYRYGMMAIGVTPERMYVPHQRMSGLVAIDDPVKATAALFNTNRAWLLIIALVVCTSIAACIYLAKSGVALKIRKIGGLEAVDEAVGRATEMGRPILFVPGIQDMNNIQTVAGMTVLSRIGRTAAEYDAHIEVPTARSLVMTTARETLESSFLSAGRPDAYNEENIYYVTDEQFGYVAYLTGYMSRKKPAACFYLGAFFAESLVLAETGNDIGAIQVAGTAEPAQLPFFVAACDYTLIGEELFAASAYLSGEPEQLGTLKGQDIGKIVGATLIVIGCIAATLANVTGNETFHRATHYIRFEMLGTGEPPPYVPRSEREAPDDDGDTDTDASTDTPADDESADQVARFEMPPAVPSDQRPHHDRAAARKGGEQS